MHWFTARDGTRFLIQTPSECATSLTRAFPDSQMDATSRRFIEQVKKECPPQRVRANRRERSSV